MPPPTHRLDFEAPIVELEKKIEELRAFARSTEVDLRGQIDKLEAKCREKKTAIFSNLTPWQRIQLARHPERPLASDLIATLIDDFVELHGDRSFRDDPAIVAGLGRFCGRRVLVVGHRKGKDTAEKISCHFGSPHPEGYRKAMAKMKLAEKFELPIISIINTPGAYPGLGAEERGQAFVIARNLMDMAALKVPIVCVVIGEGGSGGALGIGVGNRILMLEHAYYSVISPEGCAAILWKSADHKEQAAEILKLTATDLLRFGIIDEIVPEPLGGAHRDPKQLAESLRDAIRRHLDDLHALDAEQLVRDRYAKFRRMGEFEEQAVSPPQA